MSPAQDVVRSGANVKPPIVTWKSGVSLVANKTVIVTARCGAAQDETLGQHEVVRGQVRKETKADANEDKELSRTEAERKEDGDSIGQLSERTRRVSEATDFYRSLGTVPVTVYLTSTITTSPILPLSAYLGVFNRPPARTTRISDAVALRRDDSAVNYSDYKSKMECHRL
ncbi:hypothetical protein J6590_045902 [Homalodisca vitripennis]|nr:hypothetical protein J6590_045902 [Homalodisca vitripennis]